METINIAGKTVDECGWAGPLLWVCTTDDHSIHLYDARILLDGKRIQRPDDINPKLKGKRIQEVAANGKAFKITFDSGNVLEVARSDVETARFFKQKGKEAHWIYKDGVFRKNA